MIINYYYSISCLVFVTYKHSLIAEYTKKKTILNGQ